MADFFEQFGGRAEPEREPPQADFFSQFGGYADEPEGDTLEAIRTGILSAADSVPFAKQIGAALRTPFVAASEAGLQGLADPGLLVETYREQRDGLGAGLELAQEQYPVASGIGTVAGVVGQITRGDPRAIPGLARGVGGAVAGGYRLLTAAPGAGTTAARALLLSPETLKAAAGGAGYGAVFGLSESEADLTRGEFAQAAEDTLEGAAIGAGVGVGARGLLAARSGALAPRADAAAQRAGTARAVEDFDDAAARLPEERAAVKAANAEAREAAAAENAAAEEAFKAESAAAKLDAKGATKVKQAAAQAAAADATRKNALLRTGLEGKQKTLGGAKRAKARAQALVQEPLPAQSKTLEAAGIPADPSRRLVDVADELSPDARLELATGLRREAGAALGAVRDELAKVDVLVPVGPLRAELRGTFGDLPATVQAKALEQLDSMIGQLAKGGALPPAALRKLIEDSEAFANFGTPNLEAALGDARGRVFQAARSALVRNERELIEKVLPNRAPEYIETNRRYGLYSDFELGSKVMLERANKGQATTKAIKAGKVEPVAPREVPKPELRQPLLRPEPQPPQFPGGDEALAAGRKLLEPSTTAKVGARAIQFGTAGIAAKGTYALTGDGLLASGAALAGERLGASVANRWLRWMAPTTRSLAKRAAKLERLQPRFERALAEGPQAVARLHAQLMASPEYRAAFESEE